MFVDQNSDIHILYLDRSQVKAYNVNIKFYNKILKTSQNVFCVLVKKIIKR